MDVVRCLAAVLLVSALAGCSSSPAMKIKNDTGSAMTIESCVQDGMINRHIPGSGGFTFTDNVGTRTTPDDPGFACVLTSRDGMRLCLTMPTDQSARSTFYTSEAVPTASESACFSRSNPHI